MTSARAGNFKTSASESIQMFRVQASAGSGLKLTHIRRGCGYLMRFSRSGWCTSQTTARFMALRLNNSLPERAGLVPPAQVA